MSKKIQDDDGNTYVEVKPWYKKWWIWVITVIVIIFLVGAFGDKSNNNSKKSSSSSSSSVENTDNQTTKTSQFSFSNNTFKTDKLTYKITKSSIMNGIDNGKKVIVLEMNITNNTKKEVSLSSDANAYEYIHAYQKTETSKKDLTPGTLGSDDNGNSPEQSREDTMNSDSLLPGKTAQGVVMFDLVNNSKVSVTFDNSDYDTIATKEYNIQ